MAEDWLIIGKIVSPQGLKGEVRILSYSDFPERFENAGKRWIAPSEKDEPQEIMMLSGREVAGKKNLFVVRLEGINDCDRAEALRNYVMMIPTSDRPYLEHNEYMIADLVGCQVYHQPTGKLLGEVISIIAAGNDLLEVRNLDNQEVELIPFVEAIAPFVDIHQKRIEVTPPKGLIDRWLVIE
ncbi:ribosome maturation factor RimM [Pseudanabaena sp. UWO310]|uniref:ribosome maturation factor RimM n=1 Tax=Pseudanabaena sp. UWO310 TaxID=2480795 RepID=UPI00115A5622|nr:ribosome maturation factor RimM [Pseudanabaena sp. UWO310]TYQ30480.1 ribosome maturation factor RimM [Pseudanabaena sp. UWO310]